jgi:hypothetical protein
MLKLSQLPRLSPKRNPSQHQIPIRKKKPSQVTPNLLSNHKKARRKQRLSRLSQKKRKKKLRKRKNKKLSKRKSSNQTAPNPLKRSHSPNWTKPLTPPTKRSTTIISTITARGTRMTTERPHLLHRFIHKRN